MKADKLQAHNSNHTHFSFNQGRSLEKKSDFGSQDFSLNLILLVLASSVNLFFGFIKFANVFAIRFYYFYSVKVVDISVFGNVFDWVIWGVSFLVVLLEVIALGFLQKRLPSWFSSLCFVGLAVVFISFFDYRWAALCGFPLGLVAVGFLVFFGFGYEVKRFRGFLFVLLGAVSVDLIFSFCSLVTWVWNIFDYSFPLSDVSHWRFALVDLNLFNVTYPLISWLFIVFLYSWVLIPLGKRVVGKIKAFSKVSKRISFSGSFESSRLSRRALIVCLLAVVGLAILVSSYPYFNRTDLSLVGSDSSVYYKWMVDMSQKDPWIALQKDRPLSDLLMYSVQHAFGLSSETIVKIMPIVCCVGLALAVFWFVRVGLNNDVLALVAGLFTIFSFQTTVGIYAYSISNWLGLIWAFAMFASLLKSDDRRSWAYMFAAVFFGVALLFTHPYTWDVMMAVLSVYLVWTFFRARVNADEKMHALRLVSILGINISAYMVYAVLPFGRGVSNGAVGFAERSVVFPSILGLQGGLETMVKSWVGGLYANTLLVILAVLGMFSVVAFANRFSRLMFLWVTVPSLVLLVVSAGNYMFYRVVYVIPFQVLAAVGLFWVFTNFENLFLLKDSRFYWVCKIGVFLLFVLLFLNYALRSVDGAPLHLIELS